MIIELKTLVDLQAILQNGKGSQFKKDKMAHDIPKQSLSTVEIKIHRMREKLWQKVWKPWRRLKHVQNEKKKNHHKQKKKQVRRQLSAEEQLQDGTN